MSESEWSDDWRTISRTGADEVAVRPATRGLRRAVSSASFVSTISRSAAGTLLIEIPPAGRRTITSALTSGAFFAVWLSLTGRFAWTAARSGSYAAAGLSLFMWGIGATCAVDEALLPLLRHELAIGAFLYSVRVIGPGDWEVVEHSGPTSDLRGASAVLFSEEGSGPPNAPNGVVLETSSKEWIPFGKGCISHAEAMYLVEQIETHLAELDVEAAQKLLLPASKSASSRPATATDSEL